MRAVHGHDRAFVKVGHGPALLLLHGLGGNLGTWDRVIAPLAEHHTVIAPDLLGHGRSAKPRADYSLGGYANAMRDLLVILGEDRVSVVGHSFGGGVAMQFAYQYPERCERVVLVGSGGLGREVTPLLRMLTVPGSGTALGALTALPLRQVLGAAARVALALPGMGDRRIAPVLRDGQEIIAGWEALLDPETRSAFLHVLRAAVDPDGQVVTMLDRTYLAAAMPVLLVWGRDDPVIPVAHAYRGEAAMPGSRLEVLERAGHFPHRDRPDDFVAVVEDFLATTEPAPVNPARFRSLLRSGGAPRRRPDRVPAAPEEPGESAATGAG